MGQVWRDGQILRVERQAPCATQSGKILHLHSSVPGTEKRFVTAKAAGTGVRRAVAPSLGLSLLHYRPDPTSRFSKENKMRRLTTFLLRNPGGRVFVAAPPASAQTTLTMSSWVGPTHHLTSGVLQGWANEVEKATAARVKLTMLPKHPSAPPARSTR
jgi:hypothetical protein